MEPVRLRLVLETARRCCRRVIPALLLGALAVVTALAGCGGDDNGTSPASLEKYLLPASEIPGFKVERSFSWDNPIDLVAQGLGLPEGTPPSTAVEAFEDENFEAAAGEMLVVEKGNPFEGPFVAQDVIQLGSDDDAGKALDYVRKEALKQPCFSVCSVDTKEFPVEGIPGAKGVQQTPQRQPPPSAPPPFESYGVGFTIGPRLFLAIAGGSPGQVKKEQVVQTAKKLYERNAESDAAS